MGVKQSKTSEEIQNTEDDTVLKILEIVGKIIEDPDGRTKTLQNFPELQPLYEKLKNNGGTLAKRMSKTYSPESSTHNVDQSSNAKKQKGVPCQIYDPAACEATDWFIDELVKELSRNNVSVQKVSNTTHIEDKLMLICNHSSRLVADAERCLKKVERTDYTRIVLIVLHVREERALPSVSSKEHLLFENEKYGAILDIIDVAFTREMGIYSCRMNEKAKQAIYDVLRS